MYELIPSHARTTTRLHPPRGRTHGESIVVVTISSSASHGQALHNDGNNTQYLSKYPQKSPFVTTRFIH